MSEPVTELVTHKGGCHCGAVRYEVDAPEHIVAEECNCSICTKSGFLHLIVPASRFRLIEGADAQSEYQFNTKTARHFFCRHCGVKSFYVTRSNPDGYSINVRCLEPETIASITVRRFNGRNWEEHAHELEHLSQE